MRRLTLIVAFGLTSACGTYSRIRPADNLRAGQVEIAAGLATNTLPEVLTVVSGAVGLTDRLELEGHFEVYSALAELRFGLLTTADDDFALSVGVGGGVASVWIEAFESRPAALADLVLGRRFGEHVELYLGHKAIWLPGDGYVLNASRLGVRVGWNWGFIGLEAGGTAHHSFIYLGEATGYLGLTL